METEIKQERIDALREKIMKDKEARGGVVKITAGAFGDLSVKDCTGLVEDIIRTENGEVFTKFYGCSYLYKGNPTKNITLNMGLGKMMLSTLPREIILSSFLYMSAIALKYLLARKNLYHDLWVYSLLVKNNTTATFPKNQFNAPVKELRRAMESAIKKQMKREGIVSLDNNFDERKGTLCDIVSNLAEFSFYFIQNDSAYRFPLQDIFEVLNKENLSRHFYKELGRLFSVLIERIDKKEEYAYNRKKFIYFKWTLFIMMFLFPVAKRIIKDFLMEVEVDKVKLDEADWYFCLQKKWYKYRGVSLEDRIKEKERIDEEKGHIMLEFNRIEEPPPEPCVTKV